MNYQEKLNEMAMECLNTHGQRKFYTEEDMENAVIIYTDVLMDRMFNNLKLKLNQAQLESIAYEVGSAIHDTILELTGQDLKKRYRNDSMVDE